MMKARLTRYFIDKKNQNKMTVYQALNNLLKTNYVTKDEYDVMMKARLTRYFIHKKNQNKMTVYQVGHRMPHPARKQQISQKFQNLSFSLNAIKHK